MEYSHNQYRQIKETLIEEFKNRCAYCSTKLGLTSNHFVEHFYPKSKYPDKSFEKDNSLLVCSICNRNKADKFPLAEDDSPMLLNPRFDDVALHIQINQTGQAIPLTEKGKITIEILNLNRMELIEERKVKIIEDGFIETYRKINTGYYNTFKDNISKTKGLNSFSDVARDEIKNHLLNMLYANVITNLETYLSDAFINTVKIDKRYLRKFVETFHNFRNEKFELPELFQYYDSIEDKSVKAMLDVIYHDLPKVRGMYNDTLGIVFPEFSDIYKAVLKRHDFIHRNGKTKDGLTHTITRQDIDQLCDDVEEFVTNINEQILALKN